MRENVNTVPPADTTTQVTAKGGPATPNWNLDAIVGDLRTVRQQWRAETGRNHEPGLRELPSRDRIQWLVDGLAGALFPMRLGPQDLRQESEDFFVGHTLDAVLNELLQQVRLELLYQTRHQNGFPGTTEGDVRRPGATIGGSFFIDHGTGVVIGETAVIGERVRIYQAVTLGAKSFPADPGGALQKGQPRHPVVEDDVVIYAGATVLGRITIGRGSVIGGNVWLTRGVPPGSNVTQANSRQDATLHSTGKGLDIGKEAFLKESIHKEGSDRYV